MKQSVKIGFDAKRLFHNRTGLGNYSRTLVRNLRKYLPENPIYLFTPSVVEEEYTLEFLDSTYYTIVTPPKGAIKSWWRSVGITTDIEHYGIDIFHGLSNELPFKRTTRTKYLATIHDLIFKEYPSHYKFLDRLIYLAKTKNIIQNADHILAISQATLQDIHTYYDYPDENISVVYQSCEYQQLTNTHKTPKSLLYVSSITERKNLLTLLKAMTLLDNDVHLEVVGTGGKYAAKCHTYVDQHLKGRVTFHGNADYTTLYNLFSSSQVLVYPSIKEGFGIPVIEAMHSEMYVVTTRASSMVEAGGSKAYYVDDAYDIKAWADMINHVLMLPPIEADFYAEHLKSFNGNHVTSQLVALYGMLVGK